MTEELENPNRIVRHNYPIKDSADTGPNRARAHVITGDKQEEDCWCEPAILIWALKPNGRMGWVVFREALYKSKDNPETIL